MNEQPSQSKKLLRAAVSASLVAVMAVGAFSGCGDDKPKPPPPAKTAKPPVLFPAATATQLRQIGYWLGKPTQNVFVQAGPRLPGSRTLVYFPAAGNVDTNGRAVHPAPGVARRNATLLTVQNVTAKQERALQAALRRSKQQATSLRKMAFIDPSGKAAYVLVGNGTVVQVEAPTVSRLRPALLQLQPYPSK